MPQVYDGRQTYYDPDEGYRFEYTFTYECFENLPAPVRPMVDVETFEEEVSWVCRALLRSFNRWQPSIGMSFALMADLARAFAHVNSQVQALADDMSEYMVARENYFQALCEAIPDKPGRPAPIHAVEVENLPYSRLYRVILYTKGLRELNIKPLELPGAPELLEAEQKALPSPWRRRLLFRGKRE